MGRDLSFPKTVESIAEGLSASEAFGYMPSSAIQRDLLELGRWIVQDTDENSVIEPALLACRNSHGGLVCERKFVTDFILHSQRFSKYQLDPESSVHVVSWSGPIADPVGIDVGGFTLAILDGDFVIDLKNRKVGVFDYIARNEGHGAAIVVVLADPDATA